MLLSPSDDSVEPGPGFDLLGSGLDLLDLTVNKLDVDCLLRGG